MDLPKERDLSLEAGKPAFARAMGPSYEYDPGASGISFREWLTGQALGAALGAAIGREVAMPPAAYAARLAVQAADAVIRELYAFPGPAQAEAAR